MRLWQGFQLLLHANAVMLRQVRCIPTSELILRAASRHQPRLSCCRDDHPDFGRPWDAKGTATSLYKISGPFDSLPVTRKGPVKELLFGIMGERSPALGSHTIWHQVATVEEGRRPPPLPLKHEYSLAHATSVGSRCWAAKAGQISGVRENRG